MSITSLQSIPESEPGTFDGIVAYDHTKTPMEECSPLGEYTLDSLTLLLEKNYLFYHVDSKISPSITLAKTYLAENNLYYISFHSSLLDYLMLGIPPNITFEDVSLETLLKRFPFHYENFVLVDWQRAIYTGLEEQKQAGVDVLPSDITDAYLHHFKNTQD